MSRHQIGDKSVKIEIEVDSCIILEEKRTKKRYSGTIEQVYKRFVVIALHLGDYHPQIVRESFLITELQHNTNSEYVFYHNKLSDNEAIA